MAAAYGSGPVEFPLSGAYLLKLFSAFRDVVRQLTKSC